MPNSILDPTGRKPGGSLPNASPAVVAPRRADLTGVRVGLLENTKHNAALLLRELGALLVSEHDAASVELMETKQNFALPVGDDVVARYREACDVVVIGVGDCGSCSASAVADGILFERAGLPAAVICTDAFTVTAGKMAEMRGAPGYRWVVTEHPVAVLDEGQVRERAKRLAPEIVARLTAEGDR